MQCHWLSLVFDRDWKTNMSISASTDGERGAKDRLMALSLRGEHILVTKVQSQNFSMH